MMNLQFYLGRANTGKSRAIRAALMERQRNGERAILIVPEQYTFEAERALSQELGGLLGVQVLSFARLNERILALQGHLRPFLSPQGHRMVIRRAAIKRAGELQVFERAATAPGFAADMQEVFTQLKRAGLTPKQVEEFAQKLPEDTALREKLANIALLYGETEDFLADRYLTTDDAANTALSLLPDSFVKGAHVYIDGMDRPSGQLYQWLSGIMAVAASLTIALRYDPTNPGDQELFIPDMLIYSRTRNMAEKMGATVTVVPFTGPGRPCAPELSYLEQNLFALKSPPYQQPAPAITVFGASDRVAEVEALADGILSCARCGVRYREMAVIVSDPGAYMSLISRVFSKRDIPMFLDRKHPVTGHAAVDAALSAVRAADGLHVDHLLRLAKSGYAGVAQEDCEDLELYLMRTGLYGSAFGEPFQRSDPPAGAERARQVLMEPLLRLQKNLAKPTVSQKVRGVYAYLLEIGLDNALKAQVDELLALGRVELMEEHAQVWNAIMEVLSQLDAIMGDVSLSRKLFCQLLEEGLSGCEIGVIPDTSDQVLLGDLARTKSRAVKALFLVGVNDGLLPLPRNDDGLIDARELNTLSKAGMPVWDGAKERAAQDRLELYSALSKARESLFISYCFHAGGSEMAPSSLVREVMETFPLCSLRSDLESAQALPSCEAAGLKELTHDLSAKHANDVLSPRLPTLLAYYSASPTYGPRVKRMVEAGQARYSLPPLGRSLSTALYGKRIPMSASRLEQFSACPFKHFIRYGLAAADKREHTERAADYGTFYHSALEAFVSAVLARQQGQGDPTEGQNPAHIWSTLTPEDVDALMDEVLPTVIAEHNDGIFVYNQRLRATLFLLIESAKLSARAIVRQIQAGQFVPVAAEVRFGENQPFPPIRLTLEDGAEALLSGIIDRVDALGQDESSSLQPGTPLRVVDYKLGERDFDFSGILHGLTLQLPLYLTAATQSGQSPAGMYYMPLKTPMPDEGEDLEQAAATAFRLRGLTLNDPKIILLSDRACATGNSQVLKGVKSAGEDGYSGSVCSQEELEGLLALSMEVSKLTLSKMLDGHMEAQPAQGACKYCDYNSICRFDPMVRACRTRKFRKISQEEFFKLMGGDGHALDR